MAATALGITAHLRMKAFAFLLQIISKWTSLLVNSKQNNPAYLKPIWLNVSKVILSPAYAKVISEHAFTDTNLSVQASYNTPIHQTEDTNSRQKTPLQILCISRSACTDSVQQFRWYLTTNKSQVKTLELNHLTHRSTLSKIKNVNGWLFFFVTTKQSCSSHQKDFQGSLLSL